MRKQIAIATALIITAALIGTVAGAREEVPTAPQMAGAPGGPARRGDRARAPRAQAARVER